MTGDELRWKFTSDGSVNGWGWRFVVYPIMPSAAPVCMMSDRTVLSRPSVDLATCLLDLRLQTTLAAGGSSVRRLTAALAACAQLGTLSQYQVALLSCCVSLSLCVYYCVYNNLLITIGHLKI